jgi:hypothetical protein
MRVARRRHPMPPLTRHHPGWGGGIKSASLPEPTPDKAGAHVTDTHRPTPSHQTTHLALHCCASYRIHLVTYVMMESRLRMEAKHQGGPVRTKLLPAAMERYGALQQGLHAQG